MDIFGFSVLVVFSVVEIDSSLLRKIFGCPKCKKSLFARTPSDFTLIQGGKI